MTRDLFDLGEACADDNAHFAELRRERAKEQRDAAIANAVEHADAEHPGWSQAAFRLLRVYAQTRATLTAEEVRQWAEAVGLDRPPDNRAWGGVIKRARREGMLDAGEYVLANDPSVHARPVMRWRSRICA